MNKKIFSLVIQDEYIKVLSLKGNKVISYALTKLPPGIVSNDKIVRSQLIADELEALLKSAQPKKISSKYAVVEVSDSQCFIKLIKLPKVKKEEVEESLKWQLEKILPLASSQVYWDWKLIQETDEGVEILLIAASHDSIKPIIETFGLKKINIKAIEPRSVALAKILAKDKKPIMIVNLGYQKATIVIGKNNLPFFSTVEIIDKSFNSIKKTIAKAINFYQKEYDEKIKNILISGDSGTNNFYSVANKYFKEIEVEKVQLELKAPDKFKKLSLSFLSNIGLLTKDNIFNLLPESIKKQFEMNKINDTINRLIIYFTFFALLIITLFALTWFRLFVDLKNTNSEISNISQSNKEIDLQKLEDKTIKINQKVQKINSLLSLSFDNTASLLELVNQSTPPNVLVNTILIDHNVRSLKISGLAQNREQIILFRDNLRQKDKIESANIPLSDLEKNQDINFTINCVLK
jgi:Tfp pilus assembly protein PilN